jgi:hypothetical protein
MYWSIIIMMKSDNKFTYYKTDNNTDLLFQVDNNNKKDQRWSSNFDGTQKTNRMEENIPSCSSNTKNEVAVTDLVGIHPSSWIGDW